MNEASSPSTANPSATPKVDMGGGEDNRGNGAPHENPNGDEVPVSLRQVYDDTVSTVFETDIIHDHGIPSNVHVVHGTNPPSSRHPQIRDDPTRAVESILRSKRDITQADEESMDNLNKNLRRLATMKPSGNRVSFETQEIDEDDGDEEEEETREDAEQLVVDPLDDEELEAIRKVTSLIGAANPLRTPTYICLDRQVANHSDRDDPSDSLSADGFLRNQPAKAASVPPPKRKLISNKSNHRLSWYLRMGVMSRMSIRHIACSEEDDSSTMSAVGDGESSDPEQECCDPSRENVLVEGQGHLAMCMLVYMYTRLRENCQLGNTKVGFDEIDVNAGALSESYLKDTRSVAFVVRVVMDELSHIGEEGREQDFFGGNYNYDKSMRQEFQKWIEESREYQHNEGVCSKSSSCCSLNVSISNVDPDFASKTNETEASNQIYAKSFLGNRSGPFFRKNSVMSNLIESGMEIVYCSDHHANDVVYCICVSRERNQKKISIVFRGTVNSHNWLMNMKLAMTEHTNPISEDYHGRHSTFGLHKGFSQYMLRRRRDVDMTKIEEILSRVKVIGKELSPDGNYSVSICGHSLGGALAIILGFFAASTGYFCQPVRVFTFAAPRVGCRHFVHAYEHLERCGRLRHARISCDNDFVPLVPFFSLNGVRLGKFYKHVGIQVQLNGVGVIARHQLKHSLDVSHSSCHGRFTQCMNNSVLFNMNTLAGFARNHTLSEHQRRIHFALEFTSALADEDLNDGDDSRIKLLNEYYHEVFNSFGSSKRSLSRAFYMRTMFIVSLVVFVLGVQFLLFRSYGMIETRGRIKNLIDPNSHPIIGVSTTFYQRSRRPAFFSQIPFEVMQRDHSDDLYCRNDVLSWNLQMEANLLATKRAYAKLVGFIDKAEDHNM